MTPSEYQERQLKWDLRFLELTKLIATWSKDPSTKRGAVIVGGDLEIRSSGFNGFARGVVDHPERYNDRSQKYPLIVHAEENCILNAARIGVSLKGCTSYCEWSPCSTCARMLIQAGITTVVYSKDAEVPDRWQEDFERSLTMLQEARVAVRAV